MNRLKGSGRIRRFGAPHEYRRSWRRPQIRLRSAGFFAVPFTRSQPEFPDEHPPAALTGGAIRDAMESFLVPSAHCRHVRSSTRPACAERCGWLPRLARAVEAIKALVRGAPTGQCRRLRRLVAAREATFDPSTPPIARRSGRIEASRPPAVNLTPPCAAARLCRRRESTVSLWPPAR
jgi:hypothetical protein